MAEKKLKCPMVGFDDCIEDKCAWYPYDDLIYICAIQKIASKMETLDDISEEIFKAKDK